MLTRRRLLGGAALGGIAAALGGRAAAAFTVEPMPKHVASAFALACKPLAGGDHGQLIADSQKILRGEIAKGALSADARQIVFCPICGCRFTVTASAAY
jgi:hypothetical protein